MSPLQLETIQNRADDFAYITLKLQAEMYKDNTDFYGLERTVDRMCSCVMACANNNVHLIQSAKAGMRSAFNRLKNEQDLPILTYNTMTSIIYNLDEKSEGKAS